MCLYHIQKRRQVTKTKGWIKGWYTLKSNLHKLNQTSQSHGKSLSCNWIDPLSSGHGVRISHKYHTIQAHYLQLPFASIKTWNFSDTVETREVWFCTYTCAHKNGNINVIEEWKLDSSLTLCWTLLFWLKKSLLLHENKLSSFPFTSSMTIRPASGIWCSEKLTFKCKVFFQ